MRLALALVLILTPPALAQEADVDPLVAEMAGLMTGSFTTLPQAERDERYGVVESEIVRIWPQRTDGIWLYQENAWLGDTPEEADRSAKDRPYFQRIVHIATAGPAMVRRTSYDLSERAPYAGFWRTPEAMPAEALGAQTCTGLAHRVAEQYWFAELDCPNAYRGAVRVVSQSINRPGEYANWDRGFGAEGQHIWGPETGGYLFTEITSE